MAYKISDAGGWGTGALGAVLNPSGQINSYANVTAISGSTVTIGTPSAGGYETFAAGKEIMLHVSAVASGSDTTYLGNYLIATITAVNGSTLTLSKDVSGLVGASFANYQVQAVTVAQFDTLNLTGTLTPLAYSATNKYGGILALKCKTAFNVSGSAALNLVGKGIPTASIALRPATTQEGTAAQIGWENHITARKLYLNCPDGAVFIAAKASSCSGTAARIGGTAAGVANYPYNGGSTSNTAVIGGPTILWASQTISGFDPSVIAKTSSNTSGRGLGRCYIATESKLPADEGLYALDCISNPARLSTMGIRDFGTGALGTVLSLSGQVNSYAPVTAISSDGKTITIGSKYEGAYEKFAAGSRIMFHVSRQSGTDNALVGKFILANILSVTGNSIVLDAAVTSVVPATVLSNYKCQLVTVAQFDILACSSAYTGAKAYDEGAGCGGIVALAAKTTMDLSGGVINMEGKGIPAGTGRDAVAWQCSGHQGDCLPLSQGNGAILLIAKQLKLNASSLLGASYTGAAYKGTGGVGGSSIGTGNGSAGLAANFFTGGKGGKGADGIEAVGTDGGTPGTLGRCGGGAGGASLFIVAEEMIGFSIAAISTGGASGAGGAGAAGGGGSGSAGTPGGAGFGGGGAGGGGANVSGSAGALGGGGGGGTGTCFIYCNTVTSPDYTAVLAS